MLSPLVNVSVITRQRSEKNNFFTYENYHRFLKEQDILIITTALCEETLKLFTTESFFSNLKNGTIIINIARGELVNETELIDYLKVNSESLYLTDVTHPEPYPEEGLLNQQDQVYITNHVAGTYKEVWDDFSEIIINKAGAWINS